MCKCNLLEERLLYEYKENRSIAMRLQDDETIPFEPYLIHDNVKRKLNTSYYYETKADFGGFLLKDKTTGKVKDCWIAFPYSKMEFYLGNNDELYQIYSSDSIITRKYAIGSVKMYEFLALFASIATIIIAAFVLACLKNANPIIFSMAIMSYLSLFALAMEIERIPKEKDKSRNKAQKAYLDGIETDYCKYFNGCSYYKSQYNSGYDEEHSKGISDELTIEENNYEYDEYY